jgi:hypothetical protein
MTYIIDITDSPTGTYSKVKTLLEGHDWSYTKPIFTVESDDTDALSAALADLGLDLLPVEEGEPESKVAAEPEPEPEPEPESITYRAYMDQPRATFTAEVCGASDEELLARHGASRIDIFVNGALVRTIS